MASTLAFQQPQRPQVKLDNLSRILGGLCRPGALEVEGSHELLEYVDSEARNLTGERFNRFAAELNHRLKYMIQSPDSLERLGGVLAISELAASKMYSGSHTRLADLVKLLMEAFQPAADQQTMEFAAKTLHKVVRAGGPLMAGVVEEQVKLALAWLRDKRHEAYRTAGTLVLHQLAVAAPAVFNVHVPVFVEVIWFAIRDSRQHIREAAVAALRACLMLVEMRETRHRVQWYFRLFEETQRGLTRVTSLEVVHGSLLVLGELLRHTGEFLLARYKEVCITVLRFRDSKEKLVRRAVTYLLPRLAEFSPERFSREYLDASMAYLLTSLGNSAERGAAFAAIGELAAALAGAGVGDKLCHAEYLSPVAGSIAEALRVPPHKGRSGYAEALLSVGTLARALHEAWRPYVLQLLDPVFRTGLSPQLVVALHAVTQSLPSLTPRCQDLLYQLIRRALDRKSERSAERQAAQPGELQGIALTKMALRALAQFSFVPKVLLDFVRESVMPSLDDPDAGVRKAAVQAGVHVLEEHVRYYRRDGRRLSSKQIRVIDRIVQRLLLSAVTDPVVAVRRAVLGSLYLASPLGDYLAQSEALQILFVAMNDEETEVRTLALRLAGRLSQANPAYVMPALRRNLMQLLSDMEHAPDASQREDSAQLLGVLIGNAPKLVLPYTHAILNTLVTQLQGGGAAADGDTDGSGALAAPSAALPATSSSKRASRARAPLQHDDGFEFFLLATMGELARVAGVQLRADVPRMLPLIIAAIQGDGSGTKRLVAVQTLGQVVESTGVVITPFTDYPQLMGVLLRMLSEEGAQTRAAVMKVLGTIGALDPHTHKLNLAELQGEGKLDAEGVRPQQYRKDRPDLASTGDQAYDLLPSAGLVTSSEDYYPTVAINALMRVLRNPGNVAVHGKAVQALFDIIRAMGLNFVLYLPKVVPVLLQLTREADDLQRRVDMIRALTDLVVLMRQHISKFLKDFLTLILEFWNSSPVMLPHILLLLAELAQTLRDDLHPHMPELLPRFVALFDEAQRIPDYSMVGPALEAIRSFGPVLEDSLQLLLPVLVTMLTSKNSSTPAGVQEQTLATIRELFPQMQLAGHSSAVLHPLIKVLDGPDDELRERALDTICSLALAVGPDLALFVPTIKKTVARHRMPPHAAFQNIAARIMHQDPPCMSDADDWESSGAFLGEEHVPRIQPAAECGAGRTALHHVPLERPEDEHAAAQSRADGLNSLRRAWESSHRSTKDDWAEWMRNFSIELLRQSPSKALRACGGLAQANPNMARELFAAGFVSCWSELDEGAQEQLVRSLEAALASPTIPPDIVTTLLNLAEFMEHDEKALPLDTRTLGALAEKCHAYAKALHYKELEFQTSPASAVEALISINNHLRQPDAAVGILNYAQKELRMELKESWYEKLQRWDNALAAYEQRLEHPDLKRGSAAHVEALLGQCRCLAALAEWDRLFTVCRAEWSRVEPQVRRELAPVAAHAAWQLGDWHHMEQYVDVVNNQQQNNSEGAFLSAILDVHKGRYQQALDNVARSRELLGTELAALVGESYERAYGDMVRVQQLAELEEIVVVKVARDKASDREHVVVEAKRFTRTMWEERLRGVQRNVEVWQALMSVRGLLLGMHEDTRTWLKFASLCRKSGRVKQSESMLLRLRQDMLGWVGTAGAGDPAPVTQEQLVMYAWHKHQWSTGQRQRAFTGVQELEAHLPIEASAAPAPGEQERLQLAGKVHLKLGLWRRALTGELTEGAVAAIMGNLRAATEAAPEWDKAWHHWALFNVEAMNYYATFDPDASQRFVAPAVVGFFRSIELGQAVTAAQPSGLAMGSNLQDILRLLTLWFTYGSAPDVEAALADGFGHVNIDTWLVVIPQVIARIHSNSHPVRRLIHSLLVRIGRYHPQALMYPLLVACKSQSHGRRAAAQQVMDNVRQHSATLVEQAGLVSQELIRMAVLWHEQWHESLEEASRLYFGESNVEGMLETLLPLHEEMHRSGPTTLQEIAFVQAYGRELDEAYDWCLKYKTSRKEAELHQAWDLYYHVFKRINKQLSSLTTLELQYVAPALVRAKNLELVVPGTYIVGEDMVTIESFHSQLTVITSKQRPRKLTIRGSDGSDYMFLLKGHEDLRQDERVMQLFGLVNTMLANNRTTAERDLTIARYAVIPLSPNSGLIGWVPNTDTLHFLIREYRDARKIPLNVEHRLMLGMAPDYDHLTVIQKVEVFLYALDSTSGEDLHKVLWLKSRSSESWLDKRTNYTRSTAVMSMVGYILGLGDRHPSNLMLDRYSGKLLHIDFGDCFEASMVREKFPERVPFRLTRMMIKAFEVSGIEGNFKSTCNEVLRVLRSNKDSVMAMLEAFVYDPLINWRLLNTVDNLTDSITLTEGEVPDSPPKKEVSREQALASVHGDANEVLNERAVAVMRRLSDKLTGRDAEGQDEKEADSVNQQVARLVANATSAENLSVMYIGWCAFW